MNVDTDRKFTMIYSGVENKKYFNTLYDLGVRNFLMSYHYLSKKTNFDKQSYIDKDVKFFIDSGVYTFINNKEYSDWSIEKWESYIKQYLKWVKKNKEIVFAIADLDIHSLVGTREVKRLRREYFEPFMQETGIPVCYVWHEPEGIDGFEKMCERYNYCGISWASEDRDGSEGSIQQMFNIARENDTVIHGYGMTQTSMLSKYPFYTVDSTTWMIGLQYGEISYWTGNKMKRLKKDKWNEYKGKLEKLGIDFRKLKDEDNQELIKANIAPFQQAEKYIRERLGNKMYWLDIIEKSENDIGDPDTFPDLQWIDGQSNYEGWEKYAKKFNIKASKRQVGINAVVDASIFCQWNERDDKYFNMYKDKVYLDREGMIDSLHEFYVNAVARNQEEKINSLIEFFQDLVSGKETLDLTGGNEHAEERDNYITEDRFEYKDLSEEEILEQLSDVLPSADDLEDPHPEVSELDDEIFDEAGIVPVRDDKGRFVKGQKKIRRPKNIYSDKYPKLACDTCYAAQNCPEYDSGKACAFNKMFDRFDTRDMSDIVEAMQGMVNLNLKRMQRVAIFEQLDGGMPDGNLTQLIDQNMNLLNKIKEIYKAGDDEVLRRTMVQRADGTREETIEAKNPSQDGILAQLFKGAQKESEEREKQESAKNKKREDDDVVIDIDYEEE